MKCSERERENGGQIRERREERGVMMGRRIQKGFCEFTLLAPLTCCSTVEIPFEFKIKLSN